VSKLISLNPLSGKSARSSLVPCFPLQAILIALNRTTVDYFSLDVEGFEFDVSFCVSVSVNVLVSWFNFSFSTSLVD